MRDRDVRHGLAASLQHRLAGTPHVCVSEVDIRWNVPARIDVLVASDRIAGYEIKSDLDSLARLPRQVRAYGDVVEYAHLVVGPKLRDSATSIVPGWWGVWAADWSDAPDSTVTVSQVRRAKLNPTISPLAVSMFLSRHDLTGLLTSIGETQLSSKPVDELRRLFVDRAGARRAVRLACDALAHRPVWQARSLTRTT